MRHNEKNEAGKQQKTIVKTISFNNNSISVNRAISILLLGLVIGVLCSFTVIKNNDEEATEEHNYGDTLSVQKPAEFSDQQYAIKIFRYFEIFPDMRAFLFRFEHTDIKKVCEQETVPLSELERKIGNFEIITNPENGMTMFVAFENAGAYEMDMMNPNGQGVSHHTIVTEAKINHTLDFGRQVAPGIYFMQLRAGNDVATEKVTLKGS